MARRFINTLADGDSVEEVYFVADKQVRVNRNAALYLLLELRDRTGSLMARQWNVTEEAVAHFNAGEYALIKGKVQLFQGAMQMIANQVQPVATSYVNPEDFLRQTTKDVGALQTRLREILHSISNEPLRNLIDCFLIDEPLMTAFCTAPAGMKAHHAYRGGLLEHVVNMLEIAQRCADLLNGVDRNLLLAGIFLHDLGKIRELSYSGPYGYTDEGQLLGHLSICIEILATKIAEAERLSGEPFPLETALRLKHMVLSHHGTYEFGSPKLPMTPEAVALHHIDNLDAKVHEFSRDIAEDPNASASFTPFNARLDRKLFKGVRPNPPTGDK
ncbi:MAG: HD domain-containing protein [Planctomycetota bacterium]|nr:HD domain-containing protein [Planctomycetota bacterium]